MIQARRGKICTSLKDQEIRSKCCPKVMIKFILKKNQIQLIKNNLIMLFRKGVKYFLELIVVKSVKSQLKIFNKYKILLKMKIYKLNKILTIKSKKIILN